MSKIDKLAPVNPDHQRVIDEYFQNGFNQTAAAMTVWPELTWSAAKSKGSMIIRGRKNRNYIRFKQQEIAENARISPAEIAQEIKGFAFADLTDFIGLGPDELRELPPDKRRALQKVTIRNKTYIVDGEPVKEETMIYQIHDKLKAFDTLAKHIGFYEEDNKQKASTINVLQVIAKDHPELLPSLLLAVEKAQGQD